MFYVSARENFTGKSKPMNQNFPVVFPYNFSANFSRLTGNTRASLLRRKPSKRPYRVPQCVPWPRWCLSTALHNYTHTHTTTVTLDIFQSSEKIEIPPASIPPKCNIPAGILRHTIYNIHSSVFTPRSFTIIITMPCISKRCIVVKIIYLMHDIRRERVVIIVFTMTCILIHLENLFSLYKLPKRPAMCAYHKFSPYSMLS